MIDYSAGHRSCPSWEAPYSREFWEGTAGGEAGKPGNVGCLNEGAQLLELEAQM
jgi:hypothetical protein